jgi:ankyrin repeat protein
LLCLVFGGQLSPKLAAVLDRAPDIINKADATGTSPLHYSLGHGGTPVNPTIVKLLITKAADVNQHATQTGDTPMHVAAFSGSIGAMSLLLSKGANVNDFNTQHKTPLHTLIENHSVPTKQKLMAIEFLLHKSASITEKDLDGYSAIDLARHHFPDASAILERPETLDTFAQFEASIAGAIQEFTI